MSEIIQNECHIISLITPVGSKTVKLNINKKIQRDNSNAKLCSNIMNNENATNKQTKSPTDAKSVRNRKR